MLRLIDLVCDRHREQILATRVWPAGHVLGGPDGCASCAALFPPGATRFAALPDLDNRTVLAVHEAGHAVIHTALGTAVDFAEVGGERGTVKTMKIGHRVEAVLAGAAAVQMLADRNGLTAQADLLDVTWTAQHDFQDLLDHSVSVSSIGIFLDDAACFVEAHWTAIERVADGLLRRGRLDGDEIAGLAGLTVPA